MFSRSMRILVTGGAGYVGSHVVRCLAAADHEVTVYDNLSTGHRWAVLDAELVVGDLADLHMLDTLCAERRFDAILHFAAHIWVGESVRAPAKYYRNNVVNALGLFDLAARHGVRSLVFSSSAAVYGEPETPLIEETMLLAPINPYGRSKMMAEQLLMDLAAATEMRYAILRYFNVAGADPEGRIGEATPDNSHLIKVACETAAGLRSGMKINGIDYPTPDGTCVRDYVHVTDLAEAHLAAMGYLQEGGASTILNCGYGRGFSVRTVIDAVRRRSGVDFPVEIGERRPGDPAVLVASNAEIRAALRWRPRYDDLDFIVQTAWAWEQKLQAGTAAR